MDGNTTQPTNNTKEKSSIATLSNLGIRPNDFSGFKANIFSYNVEVPNETEKIEIYAKKGQSEQTISGTGTKTLKEGLNTFQIAVKAEAGNTKKYTINVTRKAKEEKNQEENTEEQENSNSEQEPIEEIFGLTELKIENIELKPQFQTDVYEYKIELKEDLQKLNITTLSTEPNANIEVTGNENLQQGENIITIIIKSENEEKTAAYQIIVNKNVEKIEDKINQEQEKQEKMKKIFMISVAGGIILIIIIIIIISKVRKSREIDASYIPYEDLEYNEEKNTVDDEQISDNMENENYEQAKKKKRSKGKRFK